MLIMNLKKKKNKIYAILNGYHRLLLHGLFKVFFSFFFWEKIKLNIHVWIITFFVYLIILLYSQKDLLIVFKKNLIGKETKKQKKHYEYAHLMLILNNFLCYICMQKFNIKSIHKDYGVIIYLIMFFIPFFFTDITFKFFYCANNL